MGLFLGHTVFTTAAQVPNRLLYLQLKKNRSDDIIRSQ